MTGVTTGTGTSLNGVVFNLGLTTVTWTATDGSGNTSNCSYTVTVTDNQLPLISSCGVVGNQTVNANIGICTYTHPNNTWNATATDNCTVSTLTYNLTGVTTGSGTTLSGVVFNLGATTVTWTATDGSGNTSNCSFVVTVVDNQVPLISSCGAAGNQTVTVDLGQCNYSQVGNTWNAIATDNCTINTVLASLTGATTAAGLTTLAGIDFNLGTTTVLWTVTDGSGNVSTCTFNVLVIDNLVPAITSCGAVGTQNVNSNIGVCTYTQVSNVWNATATDNCTVSSLTYSLTGATVGTGNSLNGVIFNPGTTTVTWTAVDNSSNSSTCSFNVIVTDIQTPIISGCPENITIGSDIGECGAIVTWSAPTFTDNCGATMTSNHNSGEFFAVGTTTIDYTVSDGSGNSSICSFTITVTDVELPSVICSSSITSCNPLVTFAAPIASDNCGILSTVQTAGLPSGSNFAAGTTTNTFLTTDIHGNTSTCAFTVTIFPNPYFTMTPTDVTCNGLNDGKIELILSLGASYTFLWSNGAVTQDLIGLSPGSYSVAVTDIHGCSTNASANISEPEVLSLAAEDSPVNCNNGNDGGIDITISGGILPYSFVWSNGEITEDVNNLFAGNNDVTVADLNGCLVTYSTIITQPDTLSIQATILDAQCGSPTGAIITEISGGSVPYAFSWSNGATVMSLYNVIAGTYTLTVTDAHNCTNIYLATITSTSSLSGTLETIDATCYGENNGEIQAIVESGSAPYIYDWSNGQSTPTATDLISDSYSVTITDAYGCQLTLNTVVNQPDSLYATVVSSNYTGGYNVSIINGQDGFINSQVFGGTMPYSYDWSGSSSFSSETQNIENLNAGVYLLMVTDANGCIFSISTSLSEPGVLEMPSGFSPNGDADNENFVVHGIDAYPENEITIYNRWGNIVYQKSNYANEWAGDNVNGEELPDATYFVILTVFATENITLKGYVDLRR